MVEKQAYWSRRLITHINLFGIQLRTRNVHGKYHLPPGCELVIVHKNVVSETPEDVVHTRFATTRNAAKVFDLGRARGNQFDGYGYVSFSLTITLYASHC